MFILRTPSSKLSQLLSENVSYPKCASSSAVVTKIKNSDEAPTSSLSLAHTDADFAAAEALLLLSRISTKKQKDLSEIAVDFREFRSLSSKEQQEVKEFVYECLEKSNMTQYAAHVEVMRKHKVKVSAASISEWARCKGIKSVRQKRVDKLKPKVIKMMNESLETYAIIADKFKLHPETVRKWFKIHCANGCKK